MQDSQMLSCAQYFICGDPDAAGTEPHQTKQALNKDSSAQETEAPTAVCELCTPPQEILICPQHMPSQWFKYSEY